MPYATLSIFYIIIIIFFSTCPYLYICNSCILCMYMYVYMYVYIYIYIYIYCIYDLYLSVFLRSTVSV